LSLAGEEGWTSYQDAQQPARSHPLDGGKEAVLGLWGRLLIATQAGLSDCVRFGSSATMTGDGVCCGQRPSWDESREVSGERA